MNYLQFSGLFCICIYFYFFIFHIDIIYECIVLPCNKVTYLCTVIGIHDWMSKCKDIVQSASVG